MMDTSWESELATLLTDLLAVQDDMLEMLGKKGELLSASDTEALAAMAPREAQLVERLEQCVDRRKQLLAKASREGLPSSSIQVLAAALPQSRREPLDEQVRLAKSRARLLKHHALTHWVVIQRTLIHLSQMLEIIATGGRLQPTYGEREPINASGGLVDRAA